MTVVITIEDVYDAETLRRLQLVELEILAAFDRACNDLGLTYLALYGTALGAIRHQGVIPWDDDIDVGMPWQDYGKLAQVAERMGPDYTFISAETDPRYPFITSRFMKKGTEFRMWSMRNSPVESGIFLDIFCLHDLPDDARKRRWQVLRCWIWEKLAVLRLQPQPNVPYRGVKRVIVHSACALASFVLKPVSPAWLHRRTLRAASEWDGRQSNFVGAPFGISPAESIYPRSMVYPCVRHTFEGTTIPLAADARAMMVCVYGDDYMTPPPVGRRSIIVPYVLRFEDDPQSGNI